MKKILIIIATILCVSSSLVLMRTSQAYAEAGGGGGTGCSNFMLGLRPWYQGLTTGNCEIDPNAFKGEENLKKSIWLIVLNIMSDVLAVVGYLAILMVIVGGYQYMMAQGDPGKVTKGKKTITNSIIGLAICMLASTISGMISDVVSAGVESGNIFVAAMNKAFTWAGVIAVIMIVIGGIQYTTSNGNPSQTQKAKQTITYAVIGLAITLFAVAIINFAVGAIGG